MKISSVIQPRATPSGSALQPRLLCESAAVGQQSIAIASAITAYPPPPKLPTTDRIAGARDHPPSPARTPGPPPLNQELGRKFTECLPAAAAAAAATKALKTSSSLHRQPPQAGGPGGL